MPKWAAMSGESNNGDEKEETEEQAHWISKYQHWDPKSGSHALYLGPTHSKKQKKDDRPI